MTDVTAPHSYAGRPPRQLAALQNALIWAIGATGSVVLVEPSLYEVALLSAMVLFMASGLRLHLMFMPMIALLIVVNLGYTICASALLGQKPVAMWIATSWYMAASVVFFAMLFSEETEARLSILRRGLIWGGVLTSLLGIAGYLHLFPGAYDHFTLYGRARGGFKDPNVLGAYLILPAIFLLQDLVTEKFGRALRSAILLGIITLAIFLAFSRAAWGQLVATGAFFLLLTFITSQSSAQRARVVLMTLAAVIAAAMMLAILLSIDSIADVFKQRASFDQSYDSGRFGRFGRYVLGFQMALDKPFGIGPLQFTQYFPEDTHNSFLNAFMSGGWISGITYPALIFSTVAYGFRCVFLPVPWQRAYLVMFTAFLGTVAESFIIDTDHWRHFWLMLGAMWGMFAAANIYMARNPRIGTA